MSAQLTAQAKGAAGALTSGQLVQRQCACGARTNGGAECEKCASEERPLQRKAADGKSPRAVPALVRDALRSPGCPLEPSARGFMEQRFGYDFSGVRVHTDSTAARSAQAIGASAYTSGSDIVFGPGRYAPGSPQGDRLLAHELTHVVQQAAWGGAAPPAAKALGDPADAPEREADAVAERVLRHEPVHVLQAPSAAIHGELSDGAKVGLGLGIGAGVVGLGLGIAYLAGAFASYSAEDLRAYLAGLTSRGNTEGALHSDLKARACISREREVGPFDTATKVLLIRELLRGATSGGDETAIIALLRRQAAGERAAIVAAIGRDRIWEDFSGQNRRVVEALTLTAADVQGTVLITRFREMPADELQDYVVNAADPAVRRAAESAAALQRITAPVPADATVTATGATFRINGVEVEAGFDVESNDENLRGQAVTAFGLTATAPGGEFDATTNRVVSVIAPRIVASVRTTFGPGTERSGASGYGRGTTEADRRRGDTTVAFHERSHGQDWFDFLAANPVPVFGGQVGMSVQDFERARDEFTRAVNAYSERATQYSVRMTDCPGTPATDAQLRPFGLTAAICHQQ